MASHDVNIIREQLKVVLGAKDGQEFSAVHRKILLNLINRIDKLEAVVNIAREVEAYATYDYHVKVYNQLQKALRELDGEE